MAEAPIDVRVYNKAFERVAWLGDPVTLVMTPRHNQQPSGSLVVAESAASTPALLEPGARVVVRHQDQIVLGGPVRGISRDGAAGRGFFEVQVQDDWRLLSRLLGWPNPAAGLGSQTSKYYSLSGAAETVVKALVQANVTRLGLPVTVAPDQGRGAATRIKFRMDTPADILPAKLDAAGIGVTVRQSGSGLVLDCYTPSVFPLVLSEAGGTVEGLTWSRNPPSLTRVVVGGPGEGTARRYRSRVAAAVEATWGDVIEGFVDARDIDDDDPNRNALMDERGDAALAEAALSYGIKIDLLETAIFRYGASPDGFRVGDRVPVEVTRGAAPYLDVIREATLSWTRDGGVPRWSPTVGERQDDTNKRLATALSRALASIRKQQRST